MVDLGMQVLVDGFALGMVVMFACGLGIGVSTWFRKLIAY